MLQANRPPHSSCPSPSSLPPSPTVPASKVGALMLSTSQAAVKSAEDSAEGVTAEPRSFCAVEEPQRQDGDLALALKIRVGTVNCLGPPEVEASSGWRGGSRFSGHRKFWAPENSISSHGTLVWHQSFSSWVTEEGGMCTFTRQAQARALMLQCHPCPLSRPCCPAPPGYTAWFRPPLCCQIDCG